MRIFWNRLGFLVEQVEQTGRLLVEQIEAGRVVDELDVLPLDALAHVLLLFELEYVLVEVIMEVLIRVVDAELLEAVVREIFKAEDIQHADRITLKKFPLGHNICKSFT